MKKVLRNIAAVVAGLVSGSILNMAIVMLSNKIIPLPAGVDNSTMEGLAAGMHLFEPKHFIMPFLAHALGTLLGAFVAAKIATTKKMIFAMVIGFFFLAGGVSMTFQIPSPTWFTMLDLVIAYIPMALLANLLVNKSK